MTQNKTGVYELKAIKFSHFISSLKLTFYCMKSFCVHKMSYQTVPNEYQLRQIFQRVDRDGSGSINSMELQSALSNGTFEPFNIETVRLLISMFDSNGSKTVNFNEFSRLWKYITDWLNCFKSFDSDNSGHIDKNELSRALTTFGYRFSQQFYDTLFIKFRQRVNFDDFIHISVHLQQLTAEFRTLDTDLDGVITISYEQFVSLIFKLTINK